MKTIINKTHEVLNSVESVKPDAFRLLRADDENGYSAKAVAVISGQIVGLERFPAYDLLQHFSHNGGEATELVFKLCEGSATAQMVPFPFSRDQVKQEIAEFCENLQVFAGIKRSHLPNFGEACLAG